MSRKTRELIILFLVAVTFTYFDPAGITDGWEVRTSIFACVVYAIPSAFITLFLTKIVYSVISKEKSSSQES